MLVEYLLKACKGKLLWEKLKKENGNGYHPSRYLLFPSKDEEYNAWALYYMDAYIKKFKLDKINILTCNENIQKAVTGLTHKNIHVIILDEKQMECLLRFCALINLNSEITIVSVREPYDTGAERLLGKKSVTKREIIWYDIFRMPVPPQKKDGANLDTWKNAEKYVSYIKISGESDA